MDRLTDDPWGGLTVQRAIVAFDRDEAGDWVALLECGHRQHVRHQPPWQERAWVLTDEGREEHLGSPLECRACDEADRRRPTGRRLRLLGPPGLPGVRRHPGA